MKFYLILVYLFYGVFTCLSASQYDADRMAKIMEKVKSAEKEAAAEKAAAEKEAAEKEAARKLEEEKRLAKPAEKLETPESQKQPWVKGLPSVPAGVAKKTEEPSVQKPATTQPKTSVITSPWTGPTFKPTQPFAASTEKKQETVEVPKPLTKDQIQANEWRTGLEDMNRELAQLREARAKPGQTKVAQEFANATFDAAVKKKQNFFDDLKDQPLAVVKEVRKEFKGEYDQAQKRVVELKDDSKKAQKQAILLKTKLLVTIGSKNREALRVQIAELNQKIKSNQNKLNEGLGIRAENAQNLMSASKAQIAALNRGIIRNSVKNPKLAAQLRTELEAANAEYKVVIQETAGLMKEMEARFKSLKKESKKESAKPVAKP